MPADLCEGNPQLSLGHSSSGCERLLPRSQAPRAQGPEARRHVVFTGIARMQVSVHDFPLPGFGPVSLYFCVCLFVLSEQTYSVSSQKQTCRLRSLVPWARAWGWVCSAQMWWWPRPSPCPSQILILKLLLPPDFCSEKAPSPQQCQQVRL